MAAMMMYIGERLSCQTRRAAMTGKMTVLRVTPADLPILYKGAAMSATTAGRMPLNTRSTPGLFLKSVKIMAISRITMKEGRMVPRLEKITPLTPRAL